MILVCAIFLRKGEKMVKKTPLYSQHLASKGKMVEFAGYYLPIHYENGIMYEHKIVREQVGMFDVSHMGEFILEGSEAEGNVQNLITGDIQNLTVGKVRYSLMCYPNGTVVDDLLIYKLSNNKFLLVVNGANKEKDSEWIVSNLFGDVIFLDVSDNIGQIAIQGPQSESILAQMTTDIPTKYYTFIEDADLLGVKVCISRTGYTGEDGFEIYCDAVDTPQIWENLLALKVTPCGLGARDTLRLEAGMPLYGHELSDSITPLEAGLSMFVQTEKPNFIGKEVLLLPRQRKRIALQVVDRGIAREGCEVYVNQQKVGFVLSGTFSPTLGVAIVTALVDVNTDKESSFSIDVRGRLLQAKSTSFPFVKKSR